MTDATHVTAVPEVTAAEASAAGARALLEPSGATLVRGADITGAEGLAELAAGLGLTALDQLEPFAARQPLGHGVWSQPAWPSTSPMCMHNELGWQREPPPYLLVVCLQPADSGGRTGVADGRAVLSLLPDAMVQQAERHGWTLLRRYTGGLVGMDWQDAFPGLDMPAVEAYAKAEGIECEWGPGSLTTRRTRPAVRATGTDGSPAWSNLLAFCSEWTMDPPVRDYLVTALGRQGLPFETSFGDGMPFTQADVDAASTAYDRAATQIDWRAGDVLLLDNVRTAHSTEAFVGDRRTAILHAGPASSPSPE
ncbi:TauD/TfdA family dioxygenase [Streptomyces sp. NPDC005571]|uniref:TauD/TfdA family dioxygenase n=1 Tax=Streptomyces sp. NPDC005571 TaxID=3156888 RepID=UPI0033B125A5